MRTFRGDKSFVSNDRHLCTRKCTVRSKTLKRKVKIPCDHCEVTAPLIFVVITTKLYPNISRQKTHDMHAADIRSDLRLVQ